MTVNHEYIAAVGMAICRIKLHVYRRVYISGCLDVKKRISRPTFQDVK
jgi:hypothetical protein